MHLFMTADTLKDEKTFVSLGIVSNIFAILADLLGFSFLENREEFSCFFTIKRFYLLP
jgi:hypothetical protein